MAVIESQHMATAGETIEHPPGQPAPGDSGHPGSRRPFSTARGGSAFMVLLALVPASLLALFWRTWQQLYAFDYGLDSTSPGFYRYWIPIVVFNIVGLPVLAGIWYAWLWLTGRKLSAEPPSPAEEGRRLWRLWWIVAVFCTAIFWGGSFFAEQDAAWHQVTMRDTAFTPSHAALFYGSFPVMIYTAFGAFLYARTRLPHLFGGRGVPISFALIVGGSSLLLFQVAFNEFGHTFWQTEEVFSDPLHWPFVIFAYLLFGVFAIWFATFPRLFALTRGEGVPDNPDGSPAIGRRWDLLLLASVVLALIGALHVEAMLFGGDWSFWVDWKDRQWWPLVTPAINMILIAAVHYIAWAKARLPVGATLAATTLLAGEWISRVVNFSWWADIPVNYTWPETMLVTALLLDLVLLFSRSYIITSILGGLLFGALFWAANWPALAPFLQPIIMDGQVLTVADAMSASLPRSQGPEYLRMIEEGHLRALVDDVTIVVSFFAGMLCAATYWIGIGIGKFLAVAPAGRTFQLQTDSEPERGAAAPVTTGGGS
ncbi:MAG: hypothetical protein GEU93_14165 [Propionibacteriales bacterium]|nr:hypothetical protein [Propionibacteriales bacterium]